MNQLPRTRPGLSFLKLVALEVGNIASDHHTSSLNHTVCCFCFFGPFVLPVHQPQRHIGIEPRQGEPLKGAKVPVKRFRIPFEIVREPIQTHQSGLVTSRRHSWGPAGDFLGLSGLFRLPRLLGVLAHWIHCPQRKGGLRPHLLKDPCSSLVDGNPSSFLHVTFSGPCKYTCTHIHAYTYMYICMYICIYIYMYIQIMYTLC